MSHLPALISRTIVHTVLQFRVLQCIVVSTEIYCRFTINKLFIPTTGECAPTGRFRLRVCCSVRTWTAEPSTLSFGELEWRGSDWSSEEATGVARK